MLKRYDCFAFNETGCNATTNKDCTGCKFFKTTKQINVEQAKTERRIAEKFGIKYKSFLEDRQLKRK